MRLFLIALFGCFGSIIFGQNVQELNRQKEELLKNIANTNRLIDEFKSKQASEVSQISLLDEKISDRQALIVVSKKELRVFEKQLSVLTIQLDSLSKEIRYIKDEYAKILYHLSISKIHKNDCSYIIGAGSFNESYRRFLFLQQYNDYRKKQGSLLLQKSNEFLLLKDKIENRRKLVSAGLEKIQREEKELLVEIADRQQKVKVLQSKEIQLRKEAKEADKKAKQLENKILSLIRETVKSDKGKKLSSVIKDNKGNLPWPVDNGVLVSRFGEHEHPVLKNLKVKNNGIDIQMNHSFIVKSVFEGVVSRIIAIPGFNVTVIIRHGSVLTVYSNLVNVIVNQNQKVAGGEKLGEIFQGDGKNGGLLHFELWDEETKQNPTLWLK